MQDKSKRKISGGRYKKQIKKLRNKGSLPIYTKVGKEKIVVSRVKGGNKKFRLLNIDIANVFDPESKKYSKAKIESVVDSPANRHYIRRNIITKGTIIKTDKGNAKVLNRPGQESIINAILIKKTS